MVAFTKKIMRWAPACIAGVFAFGVLMWIFIAMLSSHGERTTLSASTSSCPIREETRTVSGNSLAGFAADGTVVKVYFGYYLCHEAQRGDIVIYRYAGFQDPLIKIVQGVPGDSFHFENVSSGWHILINGKTLNTASHVPYVISDHAHTLLALYEHDYKGRIPENAYLILGNLINGSIDSTRFGLVDIKDILGKALPAQ